MQFSLSLLIIAYSHLSSNASVEQRWSCANGKMLAMVSSGNVEEEVVERGDRLGQDRSLKI